MFQQRSRGRRTITETLTDGRFDRMERGVGCFLVFFFLFDSSLLLHFLMKYSDIQCLSPIRFITVDTVSLILSNVIFPNRASRILWRLSRLACSLPERARGFQCRSHVRWPRAALTCAHSPVLPSPVAILTYRATTRHNHCPETDNSLPSATTACMKVVSKSGLRRYFCCWTVIFQLEKGSHNHRSGCMTSLQCAS